MESKLLTERYAQIAQHIKAQAEKIQKLETFSGEPDQLRSEIEQLNVGVKDMANSLNKWSIELDAEPRISVSTPAQ